MADWNADEYSEVSGLQRMLAETSVAGLELNGNERLLDVGCGDGFVTLLLAARLPRGSAIGVDASPRMVAKAQSRPLPHDASAQFLVADARTLPFADEFDIVVSFNALHWVVEQRAALSGIARAAKPGGRVIIQMVCAGERASLESVAMTVACSPTWAQRFEGFAAPFIHVDPEQFQADAAASRLQITDVAVRDMEWDFGSREAFSRWCAVGFADWAARLAQPEVPRFVADVVRAYEQIAGRPGLFLFTQLRAELAPAG